MASGQYQAQMGENENAKSGVAINARQRQGDRATYHFIDNNAKAIRYTGKILIDLIPKIYDTKRVMRISATDGSIMEVTIDPNAEKAYEKLPPPQDGLIPRDQQEQIIQLIFNPNVGIYDVQSEVGPSFATRRQEAFNALTQIASQNEQFMNIAGDILWRVADFPEAQILAQRWRKIIPPNITGDALDPEIEKTMNEASQKVEQQLQIITKQAEELITKERDLDIREREADIKFREAAANAIRMDYEAETKRLAALGNAGPGISVEQIQPVVKQLLREMLRDGDLNNRIEIPEGPDEGGTPVEEDEEGESPVASEGLEMEDDEPPMEGAQKAGDGKWYINQNNQWFMVQ